MSLEYWSMKLNNCYVLYKDKAYRIYDFGLDREKMDADEAKMGHKETNNRYIFPEDLLPYMTFSLLGSEGKKKKAKFDDFEITFPDDQVILDTEKKPMHIIRSIGKHYKLAPSEDTYGSLSPFSGASRRKEIYNFLETYDKQKYSTLEEVLYWRQKNYILTKRIYVQKISTNEATIVLNGKHIGGIFRTQKYFKIELHPAIADLTPIPSELIRVFGDKIGVNIPHKFKLRSSKAAPEIDSTCIPLYRYKANLPTINLRRSWSVKPVNYSDRRAVDLEDDYSIFPVSKITYKDDVPYINIESGLVFVCPGGPILVNSYAKVFPLWRLAPVEPHIRRDIQDIVRIYFPAK